MEVETDETSVNSRHLINNLKKVKINDMTVNTVDNAVNVCAINKVDLVYNTVSFVSALFDFIDNSLEGGIDVMDEG